LNHSDDEYVNFLTIPHFVIILFGRNKKKRILIGKKSLGSKRSERSVMRINLFALSEGKYRSEEIACGCAEFPWILIDWKIDNEHP